MKLLKKENSTVGNPSRELQGFVGTSKNAKEVRKKAKMVSIIDDSVLIKGESGTGKSVVSKLIHQYSPNKEFPFRKISVADLPENLFSSIFFGYQRGSFTSANATNKGLCETVGRGTIVLDDIDNLSLIHQSSLLTFLDEKTYSPLGSNTLKKFEGKLIFTTNKDLETLIEKGEFKSDFYFRIKSFTIEIKPLRERREDIQAFIEHYFALYKKKMNVNSLNIAPEAMEYLCRYEWKGNVREIENEIKELIFYNSELKEIKINQLRKNEKLRIDMESIESLDKGLYDLMDQFEKKVIAEALDYCREVRKDTAELLRIDRRTLLNKMKKYQIQ